jgi:hypothetical protein
MISPSFSRARCAFLFLLLLPRVMSAQGARHPAIGKSDADADGDHVEQRAEWFLHGRTMPGKSSAELRQRAYQSKMRARVARIAHNGANSLKPALSGSWMPLGPVPLASDATGDGYQNYNQVSGRATAVAIDPADPSGNTVYIGGAQGGVWQSTNAVNSTADDVIWTPLTDDQATLSIGAIAIQPGNSNPSQSVVVVGTGEADNSADSYFGLGILRSADGGSTWTLISGANSGTYSFNGLGATRIAFSTANTNTVVAAMAATSEGFTAGALTSNTYRGLYTSTDGGQTWSYDALVSSASEATSATSVVYNAAAGLFFAAVRYQGFYSSPDGLKWTYLANQPGGGVLNPTACPQNYVTTCPIYRGEITVVPGRNEMYVWFVSNSNGEPADQGIWQSFNGGASWAQINDSAIMNCGDPSGCGVEQGFYNLELLAVPNCPGGTQTCTGNPTDLYAGAINLYKCSINSSNLNCSSAPFINLTHVYGCTSTELSALAHVHPDQHALAFALLSSGADLMYFANDGGIYRALNGFTGLTTGLCTGTNLFDDLNQNLGSMTQFVSFSQSASNADEILGGSQDNGSPATSSATVDTSWGNVLGGDGGYNAIDPATDNFFASQPDVGGGSLGIQECSSGVKCTDSLFQTVVDSNDVGGDDGAFYFPYILDPQSASTLAVGTCRVWSGPRSGGAFTELSLNFDTLGIGTCSGGEINLVRALAAGGPANASGSEVIYATTDGMGINDPTTPVGGNVWVTTNASGVSGVSSTFVNTTLNAPGGSSINPNQFPVSSVAIDTSDGTGNTAYVGVMGFTAPLGSANGPGHVWQTTNAGTSWTDFTGTGTDALPDDPVNALLVDPDAHIIYAGTDVGVFESSTSSPAWTEVGPASGQAGFLPNVAVTALELFNSGGQKLLRASTYGRGVWQFNVANAPDFEIAVSNPLLVAFPGTNASFSGTVTALDGYGSTVTLSCIAGSTSPPSPCTPTPATLTPTSNGTPFSVTVGASAITNYSFNLQGVGSDSNKTTHLAGLTLEVVNFGLTPPMPSTIVEPRGGTTTPVSFQVTAQGSFDQTVTLSCSFAPAITGAACAFTPGATVTPTQSTPVNMTASVTVPAGTNTGNYTVTLQATSSGAPAPVTESFTMTVVLNPIFVLSEPTPFPNVKEGSTGTSGPITVASQDGFSGTVSLNCANTYGAGSCSVSPAMVSTFPSTVNMIINGTSFLPGSYQIALQGTSGSLMQSLPVPFNVGTYTLTGPSGLSSAPGGQAQANLTFTSTYSYSGQVSATCTVTSLPGAQCAIAPNPVTVNSGSSAPATTTINVPSNAAPGMYSVNISSQDVTGEPTNSLTMPLTVTQDFAIGAITPASQTITPGQSASYNLSVGPVGSSFTNAVTLACSNLPSAAQCSFVPNPVTPGNNSVAVALTISTGATSAAGTYPVLVTGTSGSVSHSSSASLVIVAGGPNFQLGITQAFSTTATAGSQQSATVSVTPNYSGSLTASCTSNIPAGQCSTSPNPLPIVGGTATALTIILNVSNSAAPNPSNSYTVNLTVADSSGQPTQSLALPITVVQDYALGNFSPATQSISPGGSATYNFSVLPVGAGYNNSVTLSCSVAPLFVGSCSISPNVVGALIGGTPAAAVMTVNTEAGSALMRQPRVRSGPWLYGVCLLLPGVWAVIWAAAGTRRKGVAARAGLTVILITFLLGMLSCGGGGSNGGSSSGGNTLPGIYTVTVTGSPASISQPSGSTVTLTVQ